MKRDIYRLIADYTVDTTHIAMFCRAILLALICVGLYFALGYAEKKLKAETVEQPKGIFIEDELIIIEGDTVVVNKYGEVTELRKFKQH